MDNFYGLGTASSYYDKRRHVNAIFMIMVDYHFYATPGFSDRLISVLKSGVSETKRTSIIANDILSRDELNFLNIVRERTGLPGGDFERIVSGLSLYDPQYKTPAGYDGEQNKRLLVDMVVAVYVMCSDYSSPSFTKITGEIGALARQYLRQTSHLLRRPVRYRRAESIRRNPSGIMFFSALSFARPEDRAFFLL